MLGEKYLIKIDSELTDEYLDTHCVCCGKPFKNDEDKNNADPLTLVGSACGDCNDKYIKSTRLKLIMNDGNGGVFPGNHNFQNTLENRKFRKILNETAKEIAAENPYSKIVEIRKANILYYKAEKRKRWLR